MKNIKLKILLLTLSSCSNNSYERVSLDSTDSFDIVTINPSAIDSPDGDPLRISYGFSLLESGNLNLSGLWENLVECIIANYKRADDTLQFCTSLIDDPGFIQNNEKNSYKLFYCLSTDSAWRVLMELDSDSFNLEFSLRKYSDWWVATPVGRSKLIYNSTKWAIVSADSNDLMFLIILSNSQQIEQIILLSSKNLLPLGRIIYLNAETILFTTAIFKHYTLIEESVSFLTVSKMKVLSDKKISDLLISYKYLYETEDLGTLIPPRCNCSGLNLPWHYNGR